MEKGSSAVEDPCGEFGTTQYWAVVWFFAVLALGLFLTVRFSRIDRWMFDHHAETFDEAAQQQNRHALFSVPSERSDKRQRGDFVANVSKLNAAQGSSPN